MKPPVILFTSLSSKTYLYRSIEKQAFNFHPDAKVIGADSNPECGTKNRISSFVQTPLTKEWRTDDLISFCTKHKITHVIPSRDGELKFWSKNQNKLKENGIHVMISDEFALESCLDKYKFFCSFPKESQVKPIPTFENLESLESKKLVVKERRGSSSKNLGLGLNRDEARNFAKKLKEPIYQPFIMGSELSAETWIDRFGKTHGILMRWRSVVIEGESHETHVFQDPELAEKIAITFENFTGLHGHCLAQILMTPNHEPRIIEINPRLGGATPLALHSGLDSILWFLKESAGMDNEIPPSPRLKQKTSLYKKKGVVHIIDPFTSRQSNA